VGRGKAVVRVESILQSHSGFARIFLDSGSRCKAAVTCGHRQGCGVEGAATDDDEIKVINSDISEVRCIYDRRMETNWHIDEDFLHWRAG